MDITGSIAVTGAGGGRGLGIALDCLSLGCDVLALILDEEQRSGLEAASVGLGGNLKIEILDITKPGDFSYPDDLDLLVNNAGIRLKNWGPTGRQKRRWRHSPRRCAPRSSSSKSRCSRSCPAQSGLESTRSR